MGMEFSDKKYVALLQVSEMSAGWQSRKIILGIVIVIVAW